MAYVDGFIVAVKKDRIEDYKALATLARDVWKEYGALDYVETLAEDVPYGELTSFPRAVQLQDDEVVVFSWIVYADKAARTDIMAKVMKDERIAKGMENMPFDGKRMIFGGFDVIVS